MADTAPSQEQWDPSSFSDIQFDPPAPSHVPRAWERIPKSSHATRHKGRTVWKRPEKRTAHPAGTENLNENVEGNERLALGDISTNTPRIVKKQRLQPEEKEGQSEVKGFSVTSRDLGLGTPRRKQRNVRKSGVFSTVVRQRSPAKSKATRVERPESPRLEKGRKAPPVELNAREVLSKADEEISPEREIQTEAQINGAPNGKDFDMPEATQIQSEPALVAEAAKPSRTEFQASTSPAKSQSPVKAAENVLQTVSPRKRGRPRKSAATPLPVKFLGSATPSTAAKVQSLPLETEVQEAFANQAAPDAATFTPRNIKLPLNGLPAPTPRLIDLNSPQIGTTLLRRESMRRKSSPGKRVSSKGKSPGKRQLKKRDTLQERDILQKFSEEEASQTETQEQPLSVKQAEDALTPISPNLPTIELINKDRADEEGQVGAESIAEAVLDTNKDLQRAVEAIEVCQDTESSDSAGSTSPKSSEEENLAETNEVIAKAELDEAQETIIEACEKADIPLRKTRSGIRFSDDTSMLKDFLSRAQANKAAKTTILSPKVPKSLQVSPKRSPRKRSGPASLAKPKSSASGDKASKRKASPNKAKLEVTFGDDLEEDTAADAGTEAELEPEAIACRRSTRTRLPAPSKTPPSGPSLIPVRRADGADPVVLQKTQAQELAIVTRANTRRNKGQAKPPPMALRDLSIEVVDDLVIADKQSTKKRTSKGKAVAWAQTLAHYQGVKEVPEASQEDKPKVRRLRGGLNGTPAAKKKSVPAAMVPPSNGTPAPKRRAKVTG